jgi:hypothetical protein
MQAIEFLKTKIDPSKITGFYPLLAVFLIVGESIGLLWLFRAESPFERTFVGVLMTVIALVFLGVVLLAKTAEAPTSVERPTPLSESHPATEEATLEQIGSPEPQAISAPDGSFIINRPPDDWAMRQLTVGEFFSENLGITASSDAPDWVAPHLRDREILVFESKRQTSVIPVPGETTMDGRSAPTALETTLHNRLAVFPMDRAQPPFFVSHPFEHNFFFFVGEVTRLGILTLQSVRADTTQRRLLMAEFYQKVEHATVNGQDGQDITTAVSLIGVEGQLQDHLLYVYYAFTPEARDPELDREVQTLRSLVDSFKPMQTLNEKEKQEDINRLADQYYEQFLAEHGEQIFYSELFVLLSRFKDKDMDDPKERLRAMELLRPFEAFAQQVGLEDEELNELWESLRRAEEGDASDFKAQISEWISSTEEQPDEAPEQISDQ